MQEQYLSHGILSNPIVAIEISDDAGRITQTNATYCALTGYSESELLGMSIADLCHHDDIEQEWRQRRQLFSAEREHLTFRKRYRTKSGQHLWADTTITIVRNADGSRSFLAMIVDRTAQHRQELQQQGRAAVLELLYRNRPLQEVCTAIVQSIESIEEGLLCSILRLNQVTGRLHKVAAPNLPDFYNAAIEGMKIGEGIGSCGAAAYFGRRVVVADILEHPYWQRARRLVAKTDLRSCWSQPIFNNDGQVLGTFAIYYTEPREPGPFELELIDAAADLAALAINHHLAQSNLQKRDQLKNEFISIAAHEFNTPLATILGYVDLMRHMQESGPIEVEKGKEYLDVIGNKVDAMSRIVNDLLDISQIEGGHGLVLNKRPTLLHKLLTDVIADFRQNVPSHHFKLNLNSELPNLLTVDAGKIVQVLENLLGNAVKYSPENSPIEIEASPLRGRLLVIISDHGIGMSSEQLERIFEKFYRANVSDTSIRGLGLGMSIVREIVEAHDGEIRIESTPGKGSTVSLFLPFD